MATSIESGLTKAQIDNILKGDQSYHGSPSSTLKTLDVSNDIFMEISSEVEERLQQCPHSFHLTNLEVVSAPIYRSQAFRSGLSSIPVTTPVAHFLFHGTKESNHTSIFDNGFSLADDHYGDTDKGYIGKGIYLSSFPEYCAAYIKDTAGISRFAYANPVSVGATCKLLGCIALVGRTRQLHQRLYGTEIEAALESRWAWVQNDGNVTTLPAAYFAQEYAIRLPQHIYPRFRIALKRVTKELIWFDSNLRNAENSRYLSELKQERNISVYATTKSQKALAALKKKKEGTEYRVVTAGHGGEELVRSLRSAGVHCHAMVFCKSVNYHKQWAKSFSNVQVTSSVSEFKTFATWK